MRLNVAAVIGSSVLWSVGATGLWGSALALREDAANRVYHAFSFAGAILTLGGFGLFALSEGFSLFLLGLPYFAHFTPSIYHVLSLVGRVCLGAALVLALRRSDNVDALLRRQARIALLMLVNAAAAIAGWISYTTMLIQGQVVGSQEWRRILWLSFGGLTLYFLNTLLLALAFRKSPVRYNSPAAPYPQSGAEA